MKPQYFLACSLLVLAIGFSIQCLCQNTSTVNVSVASDPATMQSHVALDVESYFFIQEAQFYAVRLGYYYGLGDKHLFGLTVPFVHNVFHADYAGFENTTGIGDIKMMYMAAFHLKNSVTGLSRISTYLEMTAPTGQPRLGRGAGAWLYKPGVVFKYELAPEVLFFPEVRFQFSGDEVNSRAGSDGVPDPTNPDNDGLLQNLTLTVPVIMQLEAWKGWLSINPQYIRSFSERTSFVFLRMDVGRMIGDKSSASLHLSKFVAGQPRLNVIVQARFQFFFNGR